MEPRWGSQRLSDETRSRHWRPTTACSGPREPGLFACQSPAVRGPLMRSVMTANPSSRKILFGGIVVTLVTCLGGLLCACMTPAAANVKLIRQPIKGGDTRAWFQFENQHNRPVEVQVQCLEEQHGSEWRWSRECPFTEVLGTPSARLRWTVPARGTNIFFCQVPTTERAYRLNVECRLCGGKLSHFGDHLRNYMANLVWLSCPQVGPRSRAVPLSKSKLMSRIRGGTWFVTEPFWARSPQQVAGHEGSFTIPATDVNVPDDRNLSFR